MSIVSKASAYPATVRPGIPKLPDKTPTGWNCKPLSQYLYAARRPIKMSDTDVYRLVKVKRARGGVVVRENLTGKNISVKSQSIIKAGDFLISKRQIVHGACGLVPVELEGSIVSNEYSVLRGNGGICLNYLNYLAHSVYFQQTCFHSSIGVHVEKMIFKLDQWLSWNFLIPPLAEQERIAEILSTWDRAIEAVEGLIENSQAQKKALMQQLLTGKKRLPGFDGEWVEKPLRHYIKIDAGFAFKSSEFASAGIPIIRISSIQDNDVNVVDTPCYAETAELVRFLVKKGDVLLAMSGATTGKIGVFNPGDTNLKAYLNQRVGRISPTSPNKVCIGYFTHLLKSDRLQYLIHIDAIGGAQPNISSSQIESLVFKTPNYPEQRRISNVLDRADMEIKFLSAYLKQLKSEKSALMQQLLTGKRRVKIDGEATDV